MSQVRGSIVPLVTAFKAGGALDLEAMGRLVDWQIAAGSHGLSVTGTTGEPSSLTLEEREEVMRYVFERIGGRVPFVPATGTNNLEETLRLTRCAQELGASAALLIVPYYNRPSQEGLYRYFASIATAVEIPLVIYNIPGRTAVNITPATLARLRRDHPRIVGVKESNKDFEHVCRVLHECGRDFLVYSGIELLCYPMLAIGGAGHVSATGNVLPTEVAALYDLARTGRQAEALDLHYRLLPLNDALFWETNPGPLKWVMGELGLIEPVYRLPLCEPSLDNRRRLREVMAQYDFSVPAGVAR